MSSFNPDTYLSYASDANISALKNVQKQYIEQIAAAKLKIETLDFSGWSDEVSSKLSIHCDDLKNAVYPAIDSDVNSGNLSLLITQVENLKTKCEEYKKISNRSIYPSGMSDFAKKWARGEVQGPLTLEEERHVDAYKRNKLNKQRDLDNCQGKIETILSNIKAINFSATGVQSQLTNVDMTPSEASLDEGDSITTPIASYPNDHGGTTTVTMTTSIIDGRKVTEITIVQTDMNGDIVEESTERYEVDVNDPRNSKYVDANGEVYTTEVGENGEIHETYEYTNKHNETESMESQIEYTEYELVVYDNETGETQSYILNAHSDADLAFMRMMYGNAKMMEGYKVDYRLEGVQFLGAFDDGGGSVTIEQMFSDTPSSTTVTFRPTNSGESY
jgi:hypothetical protein